jgi:hypothetical protein
MSYFVLNIAIITPNGGRHLQLPKKRADLGIGVLPTDTFIQFDAQHKEYPKGKDPNNTKNPIKGIL